MKKKIKGSLVAPASPLDGHKSLAPSAVKSIGMKPQEKGNMPGWGKSTLKVFKKMKQRGY